MELHSLFASFGALENESLTLSPGLNIIEAANESGKSTWMAFLRVMLYGLNTRDRTPAADKRRYQPWCGSPMQGRIDLTFGHDRLTIQRTSRPNAPMGVFSAQYSGTTTPVPGLTATDCGELLLGVPQEVFERSAYIRQSGIAIDRSASLEQRIAALITSGDEDCSYADAADALRRARNRRQHNKTGLLPQLDHELRSLEDTLSELTELESSLRENSDRLDALKHREAYLRHQLELIEMTRHAKRTAQLAAVQEALHRAEAAHRAAQQRCASLPSPDALTAFTASLDALRPLAQSALAARDRAEICARSLSQAEKQLRTQPFSPQTPENAAGIPLSMPPHPRFPAIFLTISGVCGIAAFLLLWLLLHLTVSASLGASLIAAGLPLLCGGLLTMQRSRNWEDETEQLRRRRETELQEYTALYRAAEKCRAELRTAKETCLSLTDSYRAQLTDALNGIRKFFPVDTIADARKAIADASACHTALRRAEQAERETRLHYDVLSANSPDAVDTPAAAPEMSQEQAEQELALLLDRLAALRREIHTTEGRIQVLGDHVLLRSEWEERQRQRTQLQQEYDALSLALDTLNAANASLQSRFSPALGEKSANIFTKLTRGKYNKVLLDRDMLPSAQESNAYLPRQALMLSQGTADQLYLAVRLAIAETVLPRENAVPILLDDALVTFDDSRMAAALDYLVELSATRQVILFTCQKRELTYLASAHPGQYHAVTQTTV